MTIEKINKQLPPIFELRFEDGNLDLYTVGKSEVTTVTGNPTRQMRRYKTLCKKSDAEVYMDGMQAVFSLFYTMTKVAEEEN